MKATPSGAVYQLISSCSPADPACESQPRLLVSHDLAANWSFVSQPPVRGELLAASDSQMWVIGPPAFVVAGGSPPPSTGPAQRIEWTTAASEDGGKTWQHWTFDSMQDPQGSRSAANATGGGTTWVSYGAHVYATNGVAKPALTASQPGGIDSIHSIIAVGKDHAIVIGSQGDVAPSTWYETKDRGAHWAKLTDPCASTPAAGFLSTTMSVAADGSWWVACISPPLHTDDPGSTHDPSRSMLVSTNGGHTWQDRGPLGQAENSLTTSLYPVSTTTAWRTDVNGGVLRTSNGTTWSTTALVSPVWFFAPLDAQKAVCLVVPFASPAVFASTRDGGATWTTHPLP